MARAVGCLSRDRSELPGLPPRGKPMTPRLAALLFLAGVALVALPKRRSSRPPFADMRPGELLVPMACPAAWTFLNDPGPSEYAH